MHIPLYLFLFDQKVCPVILESHFHFLKMMHPHKAMAELKVDDVAL
jgi:hypothetical protein